jgi:hypothetical protein
MFTFKWIRAMAVLSLTLLLAFPCYAQVSGAGYDRMDGDYIKPSKRAQPKRNFNLATQERANSETTRRVGEYRSATSATRASAWREDDREESRAARDRKTPGRNPQASSESPRASDDTEVAPPVSGEAVKANQDYETTEASDVAAELTTVPVERALPVDEHQLVYCSKRLLEFHWDVDCPMLTNVKPTRLTYKLAKEGRYTECTSCGAKR